MLFRSAGAVIAGLVFGVTIVVAQSNPIEERKALMKGNNDGGRLLAQIVRGTQPFDQAKVTAALAQLEETAKKFPSLFPDNSKTGATKATPKVWTNKADFDAKNEVFAKAVAEARAKATNLDGLKAAFPALIRSCDGCHEDYRGS